VRGAEGGPGGGRPRRSGRPPSAPRTAGAVTTLLGGRGVLGRGRGRTRVVGARRQPKVGEDGADHRGVLDGGDHLQPAATAGTDQDIEIKQKTPRPCFRSTPIALCSDEWVAEPGAGGVMFWRATFARMVP
jgi:hypothetical protein